MTDVPLPFPPHSPSVDGPAPSVDDFAPSVDDFAPSVDEPGTPVPARPAVDGRHPRRAPDGLQRFADLGVLAAVDVHVAAALCRRRGETDRDVLLAAALAVRAPRLQHVCVDLAAVRDTIVALTDDDEVVTAPLHPLPWPDPEDWVERVASSPLVQVRDPAERVEPDDAGTDVAPLTLAGTRLYLDRYWRYERRVARLLHERAATAAPDVDLEVLRDGLARRFPGPPPDRQRVAAATAVLRRGSIIAGGPGTGKTTTVAAVLQLLDEQAVAAGRRLPRVALAAPTGKAAQRLTESLHEAATRLTGAPDGTAQPAGGDAQVASRRLAEATATTLHRLLGPRGHSSRFRHDHTDPLPHDVVVVDETSMVDLALLAKLLDAVRPTARVVLLGDQHQLASVEAGSALGDVIGDPDAPPARSADAADTLVDAVGPGHLDDLRQTADAGVHDGLTVLTRVHRFRAGSGLDRFAAAVRTGDADLALSVLEEADDLVWVRRQDPTPGDAGGLSGAQWATLRELLVAAHRRTLAAAAAGDDVAALRAMDEVRLLAAHRRGDDGVDGWTVRIERWLAEADLRTVGESFYVGRPVMVTRNDRRLGLWNGDLGMTVRDDDRPMVAFADGPASTRRIAPSRLADIATVHAMTVHKAQGSQVRHAVVALPAHASRVCTRELLYTAVTRAREQVTVVASASVLRATIAARTRRTSGLGDALGREPGASAAQ